MSSNDRNKSLLEHYLAGKDTPSFCRENQMGERRFYQILNDQLAAAGLERRPRVSRTLKQPLSKTHERMGRRLYEYYTTVKGIDRLQASNALGWNPQVLRLVEQGMYDLTLFEVQDMEKFMKVTLQELVYGSK
jgi:hypothetical protein